MHPLECERYMVGFRPLHGYRPTITWLEVDRFFTVCKSTVACFVGRPFHVVEANRCMGGGSTHPSNDRSIGDDGDDGTASGATTAAMRCLLHRGEGAPASPNSRTRSGGLCALSASSYRRRGRLAILKC